MVKILREADKSPVAEVAKKHGISEQTVYAWRQRFGAMAAEDVKRLKVLETENAPPRRPRPHCLPAARRGVGVHTCPVDAHSTPPEPPPIPSARLDDLDLRRPEDRAEWDRRLRVLGAQRLAAARARLERLGVIDAEGNLVSRALPPDMLPDSDTTLETG